MAKEEEIKTEPKAESNEDKLTMQKLSVYAAQLEGRLNKALEHIKNLEKEVALYQMQDYYQRAQMLCVILANEKIDKEFRDKCEAELKELVYPPQREEVKEKTPEE